MQFNRVATFCSRKLAHYSSIGDIRFPVHCHCGCPFFYHSKIAENQTEFICTNSNKCFRNNNDNRTNNSNDNSNILSSNNSLSRRHSNCSSISIDNVNNNVSLRSTAGSSKSHKRCKKCEPRS